MQTSNRGLAGDAFIQFFRIILVTGCWLRSDWSQWV